MGGTGGSYGSQANADRWWHPEAARHPCQRQSISASRPTYYRVRVGPYAERADADKALAAVAKAAGGKPAVVPTIEPCGGTLPPIHICLDTHRRREGRCRLVK